MLDQTWQIPSAVALHDLEPDMAERLASSFQLIPALPMVAWCRGCFGCWVKTPGKCLIDDRVSDLAEKFAKGPRMVVISRLVFGGLSPAVKAFFDRSISYILPFFRLVDNHMRHERRYEPKLAIRYLFYGNSDEAERDLAQRMAKANIVNLDGRLEDVEFHQSAEALIKALAARKPEAAEKGQSMAEEPGAKAGQDRPARSVAREASNEDSRHQRKP